MAQSLLNTAMANFEQAAALLADEVDSNVIAKLRTPKERLEISLNPLLGDHKLHQFRAFIVRHSEALGPSKGGIRMTPGVTLDDVNGLAMEMTWKCALIGTPFGGGKSGIVADPTIMSRIDKETVIRSFAHNASRQIHPQVYVPAPDMGTNEEDMGHIKDTITFSLGVSTTQGCYVTGKPVILGGIPGRREATGNGVAICVEKALAALGKSMKGSTAVVQGFGNVGSIAARAMAMAGMKILAVSDIKGATANPEGLDIEALLRHTAKTGSVVGFAGGKEVNAAAMLEMPCDVLVPAAAGGQITGENAGRIQARIIAEGANGPTTPDADEILIQKRIFIIPDILCNAGGVFVSYLEYTQETQQEQMTEQQVVTRLQQRMSDRFEKVFNLHRERKLHMRPAAMYLAVKTVCEAVAARGYLP